MKTAAGSTGAASPPEAARRFAIVVVGASAGGFLSLRQLLSELPGNFACAVAIVQHLRPNHRSLIAELLGAHAEVAVELARDGAPIKAGVVYIAPPDEHLLVTPGAVHLAHTEVVNYSRPSIDRLFETVAQAYGTRAVAVVLSGTGHDGAAGVRAVKAAGGYVIVQDPHDAEYGAMPEAAIATSCTDEVLPLDRIAAHLVALSHETR